VTTSSPRDWPWRSVARPGGQQRGCLVVELWSRAGGRQRGLLARRRGSLTLEAGCLAVEAWGDAGGRRRDLLAGRRAAGSAGAAVVVSRPLLWLWALQPTVAAGKKTDVVTGHGRGRSRTPSSGRRIRPVALAVPSWQRRNDVSTLCQRGKSGGL
jgi:hypothetical protein